MSSFAEEKGTTLPSYQFNTAQPPPYPWTRNSSTGPNDPQKSPFIAQSSSISLHTAKPYIDIDVVPQRVRLRVGQPLFIPPNSYLKLSAFLLVLFSIIAPMTSLFTIPALMASYKSYQASNMGRFVKAKYFGWLALFLDIVSVIVVIAIAFAAVILLLIFRPWNRYDERNCYYNNNNTVPYFCS